LKFIKLIFYSSLCFVAIERLLTYSGTLDLFSHFTFYYILYFLAFAVFWKLKGRRKRPIYALIATLIYVITLFPFILGGQPEKTNYYTDISILQFNIFFHNENPEALVNYIQLMGEDKPDILVLNETEMPICQKLLKAGIWKFYPDYTCGRENGGWGSQVYMNAFFSNGKFKWKNSAPYYFGYGFVPICEIYENSAGGNCIEASAIRNSIETNYIQFAKDKWLKISNLHTTSPARDIAGETRDQELGRLISQVADKDNLASANIAIGDWNTTPYSPNFPKIEGMYNTMSYKSFAGTWHSELPVFMRLPLDNMLVSKNIEVLERKVLPAFGSDHLPIYYKLRVYW
jgi:endonuclease/exonuclease/phosphatase (EEP) superfamily protein YafD